MDAVNLELEILRAEPPPGITAKTAQLVFVHGAFAGAWCWAEHFLPYFAAQGYRTLALSFRGHGDSGGRQCIDRFGIADYVADLAHVLDDLDQPPVVVGHSMGGFVAMKLAERRAVAGLALLASVPPAGLMGPSMSLAMWNPMLTFEIGMVQAGQPRAMSRDGLTKALFAKDTPEDWSARYLPLMGPESKLAVADMHGPFRVDPSRIRRRMPFCVLGAADDLLIPPAYIRSTARLLGTRAEILDGLGHGMMLDIRWQTAASHLAEWVDALDI